MLHIHSGLVNKPVQNRRMGSYNKIIVFCHCVRLDGTRPFLIAGRKPPVRFQMRDRICKHIAYPFRPVFPDDCPGSVFRKPLAVKFLRDCPFNGRFAGGFCFALFFHQLFFTLFFFLFLFIFQIGFLPLRGEVFILRNKPLDMFCNSIP